MDPLIQTLVPPIIAVMAVAVPALVLVAVAAFARRAERELAAEDVSAAAED
ncbi:hypothetical protein [Collinsella vaginalis]|uniref:hypothetical protein n=1 Tax=Collinsella vaginalis TaxID=1870987 RepID=UPI0015C4EB3C|nr:hypothetical protein [Collinsella vaginalis]